MRRCAAVLDALTSDPFAEAFTEPVDTHVFADYLQFVEVRTFNLWTGSLRRDDVIQAIREVLLCPRGGGGYALCRGCASHAVVLYAS
jgi:hypothetical protein